MFCIVYMNFIKTNIFLMSLILISGCKFNCEKNPITKECINKSLNNDKNDYFIIREPDSVKKKKKGQEKL